MKIRMTCIACPTQWEGALDDGRFVYFRYRSGLLTIDVAQDAASCAYGMGDTTVWWGNFREERGRLDGCMDDEEVKVILERELGEPVTEMIGYALDD